MRNKFFKKFITVIFLLIYNIEIFAANLVVDPNSNYNTKLDESASGVPIVNISTPNDRGISINEFSEYNIDEKGQILNNADNIGRSYLGGLINANPNLAPNQAANLIILQVNGSNRSQIEGYLEALSRERVDVILSNENGLYINNSGTINIKNFTATTGRVNLKDGDFIGIDVEKGNIVIGPNGIDGTNANYVEIIAKALELRGNIVANDLKVVTGSNSTTSPTDNIAIDAKELGGMYANRIRIISTDKGAGVNSDAFIVSKDSKLEITADGKIKVNKVQGKGIDIKGKEYEQKDLAYSDEEISINADKIKLDGTGTQAEKQINLNGTVENNATIYTKEGIKTKGLTNTGVVQATNQIEVEGNLTNNGEILTNKNLTAKDTISTKKLIAKDGISVGKLENSGVVVTERNLNINKNLINSGNVQAVGKISVVENTNNTGEILTNSSFTSKNTITTKKLIAKEGISVDKLENSGAVISNKKLNVDGSLTNSGEIQTLDDINIKENTVNTGDILTNGTLTSKDVKNDKVISVSKDINVAKLENKGKVVTVKNLNIDESLINSGNIQAIENITVTNNVLNKGTILTNGSFTSKDIKNEKELSANKNITVSKLENSGNVVTNSKININGILTNTGEVKAMDDIAVSRNTTNNGSILTNKNFVTSDLTNNKKIIAKEKIDIKNLKNTGTIASGDKFTINGNLENTNNIETTNLDVTGNKLTNSGSIKADNITTNVANITNDGKILSFNNISFSNAQNIKNTDEITALKDIEANNTNLVNKGNIASNGKVSLNNSSITNTKKIASSTIEMQNNKKFDNTGEIVGNNVTLTTANDIDLVAKLHGAQSLVISGKNITNNGETTGTGTTSITASNNFTNNSELAAQTLTVTATGDVVNNKMLSAGKVSLSGNNIQNNDLIAAAGDLTLTATNKVDNKSGKTIFAGNKLTITAKEILNNKNSELLGTNIELTADKVRNEVGTIKAFNDITIKTDKFENIGEVKDLDKYESYYETWDGKIIKADQIDDWKRYISPHIKSRSGSGSSGSKVRRDQRAAYKEVANKVTNDKYKSLLFPKYKKSMEGYLGNEGEYTEKTGTAKIQTIPLKEKVRSKGETEYGKVLAGRNITIEGKDGGKANEVLNKDSIISAGNTVKIDTNKLENIVSIGEKVKVKTGEETMFVKYHRKKRRFGGDKISAEVTYTRDFTNDYITKKVPVLDENGKQVYETYEVGDKTRRRKKYETVTEYVGRYAYVTGSPSIIEGRNVVINPASVVKQEIDDANGKINEGKENKVIKEEKEVHTGTSKEIKEEKIAPDQINVKDELKKYGNVGTNGTIYNGNKVINGEIVASTKVIDEIIKNGKIDIDASLSSALFIKNISPDSKYIMETRPKYINQSSFYGSDYFLTRIGYEEKWDRVKRLGDAYYENELIERSITEKLGTRFLNGKEISAKELMDNAAIEAKKNALTVGNSLTKEQIAKLDKDIVWYEYQNLDGIQVLVPKIYLSQNTLKNLNTDSRSRITGIENTYVRTGNLENTGLIGGYGNTYVEAKEVNNRALGNQLAEIRGNNTTIIAQNNINNIGARIFGNENLNLIAIDGDIVNKSTIEKIEFNNGEFDRSKFTKIDSVGEIVSNGNLNMLTNNYTSVGAITQAKNANINVAKDINIKSQEVSGEQKFGKDDSQYNYYGFERNLGSVVKAENLNTTASNLNISGSAVTTKTANLNVDKLNIESKVDKEDEIKKSSYKSLLKSGSKKETIHNEENSAGSLYVEGEGLIKGDVNLVGSNLVLGDKSFIGGKLTTDSRELHNSYSLEEKKKGLSGGIGSSGFSIGYGKSESKLKEKDLTNAKSNLVLGDNVTLNKGADITATNLIHGQISINNGDVKFGARKDVKDVETSSNSSGFNLSVRIKSEAVDRAKQGVDSFKQMKSGDILGGIASSTNTVTGIVQGLSGNITKKDGSKATLNDIKADDFKVNNNFYADAGVNLGFNKSSSKTNSHNESAVVTTIRGKDENSSITYNNVKNIEYVGTQAQNTKFIYNNVENITKRAVELNNYSSSSSRSSGISTGVTIGYGDGVQTSVDAVKVSASQSKMNSNGTSYQNGRFVDVDEVHNNTKNMTLSGFNQEGGKVTGNIQNLTIESKQNTSTIKGSTIGGSLSIAPNGMPSGSASYSQTNGERRVVDNASTFIIGDGSNLKVAKVENTAAAIGTSGNGKLSIDEYVGHNLENVDKLKTVGGSVGVSASGVTSIGVNYSDRKQEGITKNTVIGNVEIGKSSGAEINKDLGSMTEITKNRDFKTDINIESQTIKYALNPSQFKEDLQIAIIEGKATGRTVVKTIDNVINGDKSQDIGDAERRSLIEIKEAIVRVQTAPAMDIIAEKDLADKNVQKELGVVIEKFDPNDPSLSEKVRERIDELKAEGKEIVAFYDKVTKKIFINQNAKDDEVRASIAREYKIKEDLKLGRGKENDKGQLRSTVAGEIAYDEIKDRLKKGDKNPISASSFDVAKMDKDSEVTSDQIGEQIKGIGGIIGAGMEFSTQISEMNDNPDIIYEDPEGATKKATTALDKLKKDYNRKVDYMIEGWHRPEHAKKELPILKEKIAKEKNPEIKNLLTARYNYLEKEAYPFDTFMKELSKGTGKGFVTGVVIKAAMNTPQGKAIVIGATVIKLGYDIYKGTKEEPKIAITFTQANDIKKIAPEFYKDAENLFRIGNKSEVSNSALIGAAENYYKNNKTPDGKIGDIAGFLAGAKVGGDFTGKVLNRLGTNSNSSLVSANKITNEEQLLLENKVKTVQGKVLINDGTPGGTTMAYQKRITYPDGSMKIFQENLTTGETSFQGINPLGQRVFETSLIPYEANTLIGANSSSKMLVENGVVSQSVISRVSYQTGNNSLVLYDKTPVPVATNGTLVAPLTVPLLTNGANQVSQVQNNRLALENTLIWNKITPVYPDISPTFIPRAFIIESNGKKFFVTPNATKHIAEDFIKKHYLADGSDINYALKNQILLKGFGAALDQITNSEIQYGKKYYTDNWEIMINKRSTDKYPAIYHGIIREGVKK
ncbi:hemagglutinin repeat-containing protein [Fusobacterium hwasookii]|uniref:two-partner secretion domain-containing protein n=2 Tax=Fusobacterium hwasookii TaxID=1583098 RepID=UPI0021614C5C|nr:hemagglutinin repeat-containing protein [Fusobacterium hwasookii]